MAMEPFEVPNLDALPVDTLGEYGKVYRDLALYCDYKTRAMINRANGKIDLALKTESSAQFIYEQLPAWAKW